MGNFDKGTDITCKNRELKGEVMVNEKKLKNNKNNIYMDDDYTTTEREVEKKKRIKDNSVSKIYAVYKKWPGVYAKL